MRSTPRFHVRLFLTRVFSLGNQQSVTIWNCIMFVCQCRKVLFIKHSTVCTDGYWNTSSLAGIKVTEIGNRTWQQSWCGNGWPLATLCNPRWAGRGLGSVYTFPWGRARGRWPSCQELRPRSWPWEICRLRCNAPSSCKNNSGTGDQMTTNLMRVYELSCVKS